MDASFARLFFMQSGPATPSDSILQYGALGACFLIACWLVWLLLKRLFGTADRDRLRADRLEEELANLNREVRTSTVDTLEQNARLLANAQEAIDTLRAKVTAQKAELDVLRGRSE